MLLRFVTSTLITVNAKSRSVMAQFRFKPRINVGEGPIAPLSRATTGGRPYKFWGHCITTSFSLCLLQRITVAVVFCACPFKKTRNRSDNFPTKPNDDPMGGSAWAGRGAIDRAL
jgi:hypothetical protein